MSDLSLKPSPQLWYQFVETLSTSARASKQQINRNQTDSNNEQEGVCIDSKWPQLETPSIQGKTQRGKRNKDSKCKPRWNPEQRTNEGKTTKPMLRWTSRNPMISALDSQGIHSLSASLWIVKGALKLSLSAHSEGWRNPRIARRQREAERDNNNSQMKVRHTH